MKLMLRKGIEGETGLDEERTETAPSNRDKKKRGKGTTFKGDQPTPEEATKSIVVMSATELLEKGYVEKSVHLGNVTRSRTANTTGPREPTGGSGQKGKLGAPSPEKSSAGTGHKEISKRGGHKAPYKETKITVGGSESSAASNYLKMTAVKDGKSMRLKLGSMNKANFDHKGNLISIQIDKKTYPCANHLVKLPSGVYRYSGMSSVASKVIGA